MVLRNFAVFEGIDGTGTTTQINELTKRYADLYGHSELPVWFTCEPTRGEIGKLVRRGLSGELKYTPDTMARLFAADRGEHIFGKDGIKERLDAGMAVFSDRYFFSSLAYQGTAAGEGLAWALNKDYPLPEYLFFFDIEAEKAMDRVEKRSESLEIYEKRDFQKRVRTRYLDIIDQYERENSGMTIVRIDATESVGAIAEKIWSIARNLPKV
jgi:dTMP kinase